MSTHDTFWDFVSLTPESTHMVMWLMSDRAIPRAYANMEGFGVHTYRWINAAGESTFVKYHWKPVAGMSSLVWDEAQKLAGKDADFNRRQLWESIEAGNYPEYELGVQLFDDAQADAFDFDVLDPTKLIPEELVPVQLVGKMVLDRNPDNFFAETEQIAFCVSHVVPGVDFSNDPLLQGRIFSYLDTQLSRLGGPNFHQIPINRPVCPFRNGQQDGFHQMEIRVGKTAYDPNSVDGGWPKEKPVEDGGFASYLEQLRGDKRRVRADSFKDHFSQATLFWNSQTDVEKEHIAAAVAAMKAALKKAGATALVLAEHLGTVESAAGEPLAVDHTIVTMPSIAFDAVYVPGGPDSAAALASSGDAVHYVAETYKHVKPIAAAADGVDLLRQAGIIEDEQTATDPEIGVFIGSPAKIGAAFTGALAAHRVWTRSDALAVPA